MLGFIKNLFGKGPEDKKTPASTPSATPAAQPKPAAVPAAGAASTPSVPAGEMIEVSLKGVVDGLPPELKPFVTAEPAAGAKIKVSLQKALEGLPKGNVKIPYADLKAQGGSGFGGDASYDQTMVNLPLKEVLSQVSPKLMTMRQGQKTVDVPDDIKPVFGDSGRKSEETKSSAPAPAAPAAPAPKPVAAPTPPPPPAPKPAAPAPPPAPKPAASVPPPPPAPAAQESAPIKSAMGLPDPASLRPAAAAPKPPAPAAAITPPKPAEPKLPVSQPLPTSKPAAPAPTAPAPAATSGGGTLSTGLEPVFASWPEDLKGELSKHDLAALSLALPLDQVEPLMRKGKILFPWKQLRSWITPALPPGLGSSRDAENLELPLKVIIPLFMSARKPGAAAQKTIAVDQNIPDVFSGRGLAAAPAPAAPAPATPPAAPVAAPAPPTPAPAPTPTGPADLVAKVAGMPAVAGVVLASQEGLKVASQLPAEFNGDAFAGFVVAMFSRMNQFTGDLKLGEPKTVTVQTGNRNLVIIRSGRNFLAVIGKPDAILAIDDLKQAAATLS